MDVIVEPSQNVVRMQAAQLQRSLILSPGQRQAAVSARQLDLLEQFTIRTICRRRQSLLDWTGSLTSSIYAHRIEFSFYQRHQTQLSKSDCEDST